MRNIYLDSFSHYSMRKNQDGSVDVIEYDYGDVDCPHGMGNDKNLKPVSEKVITTIVDGEEVEFIYSSIKGKFDVSKYQDHFVKVSCADDFEYLLHEIVPNESLCFKNHPFYRKEA